jgi:AraC-like DNA-binding protein
VLEPVTSEVLTYPSTHVVFEGDEARITGVQRAKFIRRIEGAGEVFGIKFRPGMFRPLSAVPMWKQIDRVVPLKGELGLGERAWRKELWAADDERERAERADALLAERLPPPDARAVEVRDLIARAAAERDLLNVARLAEVSGHTSRMLQRRFREYVGVGPKWVIRRFRLQEAAERLETSGETVGEVAHALGYFDQAHFVRDFKSIVGRTPEAHVKRARALDSSPHVTSAP